MKVKFTYTVPAKVMATLDKPTLERWNIDPTKNRTNVLWWHGPLAFGDSKSQAKEFKNKPSQKRLDWMLSYVKVDVTYPITVEVVA